MNPRWLLTVIPLVFGAVSCAPAPRAIIPPPSEVRQLNVKPVASATVKTRDAVRDVAAAGDGTRRLNDQLAATSKSLTDAVERAEKYAAANKEFAEAYAEIQKFTLQLSNEISALTKVRELADEKVRIAIRAIDELQATVGTLETSVASQAAEIRAAKRTEETLRTQVDGLSKSAEKLAVAEDKLSWWRWYGVIVTGVAVVYLLIRFFGAAIMAYARPRIPFLQ
jgi:DNA repair ATPase RecN